MIMDEIRVRPGITIRNETCYPEFALLQKRHRSAQRKDKANPNE